MCNLHVDSGHVSLTAANTPRYNTNDLPASVAVAHQWATSVTLAGILTFLTTGANEARVQIVAISETSLTELILALVVVHDRDVHLLEDVLVLAVIAEGILTPAGSPAALSGEIGELVRQASRGDMWSSGEVHRAVHLQNGQIVVQGASVVLGVNLHGDDIPLDVRIELNVMVYVPFAETNAEIEAVVTVDFRKKAC